MNSFSIYHRLVIQSTTQKVFEAVSHPEHLTNWWPKKCSGKPNLGEVYNFFFAEEYDWYGKVTKCEKNKKFHITMTESDEDWNNTSFGFDLTDVNSDTQLDFWHQGWPHCNAHFKRSSYCWAQLLSGLKNYLEKGVVIPFEERE
ncbi:MAG: SRPBCC domain-containing protein [Maribacter sp.]